MGGSKESESHYNKTRDEFAFVFAEGKTQWLWLLEYWRGS